MNFQARCHRVELLISDVDGVLTDGGLVFDDQGVETKKFHVRDGLGIKLWQSAGYSFGIITARQSTIVQTRADELKVDFLRQGREDKGAVLRDLSSERGIALERMAYIGDDLPDLLPIQSVGLGVAVANAALEVREAADHVTQSVGGQGAVRELVESILKAQGRWSDLLAEHYRT